jgi:hypothetical protein
MKVKITFPFQEFTRYTTANESFKKPEILCTAILTISQIHGKEGTME